MPNEKNIRYIDPDPKNKRRILYTNPRGARYEQGGELFTCGGVHIDDAHLIPKPKPVVESKSNEDTAKIAAIAAVAAVKAASSGNPEPGNPESSNPESSNPESSNPESSNPESSNPESSNPESKRAGKLNMEKANEIRQRSTLGATNEALAVSYGVTTQSIKNILDNTTYQVKS